MSPAQPRPWSARPARPPGLRCTLLALALLIGLCASASAEEAAPEAALDLDALNARIAQTEALFLEKLEARVVAHADRIVAREFARRLDRIEVFGVTQAHAIAGNSKGASAAPASIAAGSVR